MSGIFRLTIPLIAAFCIGTVVVEAAGFLYLASSGKIDREKIFQIAAVVHDVDLAAMQQVDEAARNPAESEQVSLNQVLQSRVAESLDRDMREMALRKALDDLRRLQDDLETDRRRYNDLKEGFDRRLALLQQGSQEAGLLELQRTLEALKPKQSKDQILKIIDEAKSGDDEPFNAVVAILKGMPVDSRKKIIAEFRTEEEGEKLHEILARIRLGQPETEIYKQTRDQLDEFQTTKP